MLRFCALGLLFGLAGCGSSIGALDGLPAAADVSDQPWPLLVDTPEPPEERLTAGNGERAVERLTTLRGASEARLASASAVQPVSDSLLARGAASHSRTQQTAPAIDEADLLARAARLQARAEATPFSVGEADLQARAALSLQRATTPLPVDEAGLEARATRNQQSAGLEPPVGVVPVGPRLPVPLRPLDTPVVSSSFEERARLARQRAAGL